MNIEQNADFKRICLKENHKLPILRVIINQSMPISNRFLCYKCYEENKQNSNTIDVELMDELINTYDFQTYESLFEYLDLNYDQIKHFDKTLEKQIEQLKDQQQIKNQDDEKQIISKVSLITTVKKENECYAITFNNTGSMLIMGSDNDIKIWKLQGSLKLLKKLTGHNDLVYCIVFSKKMNWFCTGSLDCTIKCWKQYFNGDWQSYGTQKKHLYAVTYILLNNNEDELISCGNDSIINIWKINCQINQIEFYYTLEKKYTKNVWKMTLNPSETYLVICNNYDQKLILMRKEYQNKWEYQDQIQHCGFGSEVLFVNDHQIFWQQYNRIVGHLFEIDNGKLINKFVMNILKKGNNSYQFPIIFNKRKQIFIHSHDQNLYIFKQQKHGKLKIVKELINFSEKSSFGTINQDGQFFVLWSEHYHKFNVLRILYPH